MPETANLEFFANEPLIRHDLEAGTHITPQPRHGRDARRVRVRPRSADAPEGDGWLIGYVIDRASQTTDLAILDATTLGDAARVHIPHVIPPGFHGNWMPRVSPCCSARSSVRSAWS